MTYFNIFNLSGLLLNLNDYYIFNQSEKERVREGERGKNKRSILFLNKVFFKFLGSFVLKNVCPILIYYANNYKSKNVKQGVTLI